MGMNRSDIPSLLLGGERKSRGGTTGRKIARGMHSAVKSKSSPGDSLARGAILASKKGRAAEDLARGAHMAVRRQRGGPIAKGYIDEKGYRVNDVDGSLGRKRRDERIDKLSGLRLSTGGSTPTKKKGGRLWIQDAINPNNKGSLHKSLHISVDKKIPLSKLHKAEHSKSPTTRKRAHLAETLRGFNHRPRGR